ncbi:PHP domain-containing protein [Aeromicrobium fastidiosum]|uniref:PHP domain-containing protein n=1 Tax=Aeromicrobium fastidiosum TaxID=52699 RepID=UPI00202344BD|nr:PHP domain-containing protein [Aeromicrobium fastidiosum]MCL8250883.1 PHP domain-containing protein [Aeromicrobium fastidiosum]
MRIDLHTHSNRSDGTDTPRELVEKAAAQGLDVVALTDHDSTAGWAEARAAAERAGIELVGGIEISTMLDGVSIHLLGYGFDPDDPALLAELGRVLGGRDDRLPALLDQLAGHGMPLTVDDVVAQSGAAAASGRPHVADAMVAAGYVRDRDEAFRDWLYDDGPVYVARYGTPLRDAIDLVAAAGGVSVVAHPWARKARRVLTPDVIAALAAQGLGGVEVDHLNHSDEARKELRGLARDLDLVVTGSSDYHGAGKGPEFHLGAHTTAPEELERLLGR